MSLKFQTKVQLWFERIFSAWADIVSKRTWLVFILSTLILAGLSVGNILASQYKEQALIWTPNGNPTLTNKQRSENLFPVEVRPRSISLIVESKGDSLITLQIFKELKEFEDLLYSIEEYSGTYLDPINRIQRETGSKPFKFTDICKEFEFQTEAGPVKRCVTSDKPLDFVYEKQSNSYRLDLYTTEEELLKKVQTGKGDPDLYMGSRFIYIEGLFGETEPEDVEQQLFPSPANPARIIGMNDLRKAKIAQFTYYVSQGRNNDFDRGAYQGFEESLKREVSKWRNSAQAANYYLFTEQGYYESWAGDVQNDLLGLIFSIGLVGIYVTFFLGSCSPTHCRLVVALGGTISIILSFFAGFGLLYYFGFEASTFHSWLPFLMMSIGVEHMFVICNAVDQTDLKNDAFLRIHEALSYAGPSITITSLATTLAFVIAATVSSLEALRSFCFFASVCVAINYVTSLTFFLAFVVWDTRRVSARKKECFGACCCAETSRLFCKGKMASQKQRQYSGNVKFQIADISVLKNVALSPEVDTARRAILKNSMIERCCGIYLAPILLSNFCRIVCLLIYIVLIGGAIYQAQMIEVFFDKKFLISQTSEINTWIEKNEAYFKSGGLPTQTFIEGSDLDFSDIEIQNRIHALNSALQECKGCERAWHQKQTLRSWFTEYTNWVSVGSCSTLTSATIPGMKVVVPSSQFYPCLEEWFLTDEGRNSKENGILFSEDGRIKAWTQQVIPVKIDNTYIDGPKYLNDLRRIEGQWGVGSTYSWSEDMLTHEMFMVIVSEALVSCISAVFAVFIVVMLITGSLLISALVFGTIILIEIFLTALIPLWGLTFNHIVVVHLVANLGISVLFSLQIALAFFLVEPPEKFLEYKQRKWKARVALSRVGSSLLHGGVAISISVLVVGLVRQSYFFVVFYKLWLGIIGFSMANAFILLPIILSFVGPTPDFQVKKEERKSNFFKRMSSLSISQISAMKAQYMIETEGGKFMNSRRKKNNDNDAVASSNPLPPASATNMTAAANLASGNDNEAVTDRGTGGGAFASTVRPYTVEMEADPQRVKIDGDCKLISSKHNQMIEEEEKVASAPDDTRRTIDVGDNSMRVLLYPQNHTLIESDHALMFQRKVDLDSETNAKPTNIEREATDIVKDLFVQDHSLPKINSHEQTNGNYAAFKENGFDEAQEINDRMSEESPLE